MGDLFEQMHRENLLAMGRANPAYAYFEDEAKKFAKELIGEQEADNAATEVTRIKEEGVYPYEGEPEDEIRKAERDVFDVLAVQVNRAVPQLKTSPANQKADLSPDARGNQYKPSQHQNDFNRSI